MDIFGGRAYKIREHIYYLKRGEVFTIEGRTFLALGGAMSHDKDPQPASDHYGKAWPGRTEGIDWWPKEVPSREDKENTYRNLERVDWKVGHVITHTCPVSQRLLFGAQGRPADLTEAMLQALWDKGLEFSTWHFGHFHQEQRVDRFVCHYNKVRLLDEFVTAEQYKG